MNFKELMASVEPGDTTHIVIVDGHMYMKTRNESSLKQSITRVKIDKETGELTPFVPEKLRNEERKGFARAAIKANISAGILSVMLKVNAGTIANDMKSLTM